jgi:hypothetical protein
MINRLTIVTLVNREELYSCQKRSLQRQSRFSSLEFLPIYADKMGLSASKGLNRGIRQARSEWIVCAHQDVIFPDCWLDNIAQQLEGMHENVAVIGLVGMRRNGTYTGHIKDPHGHRKWPPMPTPVVSIDEHVITLRKSSGILFDEDTPGFHCYGTDICLTARARGLECIVIDAPVVHLSGGRVEETFKKSADWLLAKWGRARGGVIPTCSGIIYKPNFLGRSRRELIRLKQKLHSSHVACTCDSVRYSDTT